MAIVKAISRRFSQRFRLTTLVTVLCDFAGEVDPLSTIFLAVISTLEFKRDASSAVSTRLLFKDWPPDSEMSLYLNLLTAILYPIRFYSNLSSMADNLRRAVQDINLGADEVPIAIPEEIVNQAMADNRFILIGRPLIPRRQNIRSIVASLPRIWGQAGIVHGRIVEGGHFQFIFPTEESLDTVLRRGPWAFNDRMLILQRWVPQLPLLDFIPFWIQIRGIPYQFLNRGVVEHIGRSLGQVLEVDFDAEAVARMDYARVLVHWDITHPLRFQRNFQFSAGTNTLLRFRYERLRGFCEVCGMLTHDSGACVIQNGGEEQMDDNDEDDFNQPDRIPNQGVIIREIEEGEEVNEAAQLGNNGAIEVQEARQIEAHVEHIAAPVESDDDKLSDIDPNHDALAEFEHYDMFSGERNDSELLNPIPTFENSCGDIPGSPSHQSYSQIYPLALMESAIVINPTTAASDRGKRKREDFLEATDPQGNTKLTIRERGEGSSSSEEHNQVRGAVGPNPPLPP